MKTTFRRALLALSVVLFAAACGDDADPAAQATTTTAAADVPTAIVSLSPTSTEVLFAIGAGDQVVAVDDQSNHPEDAPITDLSGYQPNLEAIVSYEPDLVVVSSSDPAIVDGLESLGIDVVIHEAAVELDDVYDQIEELGELTGHLPEATALVEDMRVSIEAIAAGAGDRSLTAYWELDPTYYSVTGNTFIGTLLSIVGINSIADDAQDSSDYPQLSAEFIVAADPDLILLADTKCCGQTLETVAARDGWGRMKAVTDGHVIALDDDVASRWGPRVVELLQVLDEAAAKAAA